MKRQILKNSRENNARGVYIRLVTISCPYNTFRALTLTVERLEGNLAR